MNHPRRANLGDELEQLLIATCEQYEALGLAQITKLATPYKVVGSYHGKLLVVPDKKAKVDFMGKWQGQPIAFEAKSTNEKTRYPLDPYEREEHQRRFLHQWAADSIAGYAIGFVTIGEYYWLTYEQYGTWFDQSVKGGRKSIPIKWFREQATRIRTTRVPLDFLAAIKATGQMG